MDTQRVEAFSDGVIAILITIMVLELKVPEHPGWDALRPEAHVFGAYVLSFIYIGIYWNNHHHMFHITERINGSVLWANLHLLFWLSLVPVVTAWMGDTELAPTPTAAYGAVMFCAGVAYVILQHTIIRLQGPNSPLAAAIGNDVKGKTSAALYAASVGLAFVEPWISALIYIGVALMWLVPDRRIESRLTE
jgi:uncharacterized membrane protein